MFEGMTVAISTRVSLLGKVTPCPSRVRDHNLWSQDPGKLAAHHTIVRVGPRWRGADRETL
jgi:hypothetical protein